MCRKTPTSPSGSSRIWKPAVLIRGWTAASCLPGQNWPRSIEAAISTSDFFLACFSHRSVKKKGGFQAEIRYALECTQRIPLDEIFLIPARLDACPVPMRIQRETQYIDLFPDWDDGLRRVVTAMRRQWNRHAAA